MRMDIQTLVGIGFTQPLAKTYIVLIKSGPITPAELSTKIAESRTNTYKLLDKLVDMGVVSKSKVGKKLTYRPENPVALENSIKLKRNQILEREQQVKAAMPTLLSYFYTFSDQPGIRFFQGKDSVKELFNDTLRTGKEIHVLRSPADTPFFDQEFFDTYRKKRAAHGIKTHLYLQDNPNSRASIGMDKAFKVTRTWLPAGSYDIPVEWDVYGDKVAIISYGQEALALLIESPQIADSFRQMLKLLDTA